MKKLTLFFALFAMLALGVGNAWAEEATVYTSNVELTTTSGTKATASKAKISSVDYSAMKLGSSGNAGNFYVTVPANTTTLTLHAAAWNGKNSNTLTLSTETAGVTISPSTAQTLTANSGVSGNSTTYTITPNDTKEFFTYTVTGATSGAKIKFACSERCLIWGVNAETSSAGGGETPDPTPTTQYTVKWYTALGTSTDVTLDEGAAITKPATDPTMSGYEFMGWTDQCSVAEDGTGFTALTEFGTADADKEFYAVFAVATTTGGGGSATETTATVSISDYATANSWSNSTKYTSVTIDANITATVTGGGNTGKYYTSGTNWRLYQNETPSLTLTAAEGYTIKTAKVTYSVSNTGVLTLNSANVTSGTVSTINASTVSYGVGNTGSATNGQVRVTAIEVVYTSGSASVTTYSDYKTTCSGATVVETLTDAQFAWSAATAEATMGATNTFPTLTNTLPVSVTYESSTPATATIAADGTITLIAPGTTTISAKFAGGEVSGTTYAPKTVTYALTVLKAPATPTSTVYVKVISTAGITDGEYLIVYEDASNATPAPVAFDGSLEALDAVGNTLEVTINNNTIAGTNYIDAATFTIDVTNGTILSAGGKYIGKTANSNGLDVKTTAMTNTFAIDANGNAVITGNTAALRYNKTADQKRFRYYKDGGGSQEKIALYKKASKHTVTIADCTNGTVSAKMGETALATNDQVLSGIQITLSNEAATGYKLAAYDVYKTGEESTKVTVADDYTFIMPEFDVTISATFEQVKTLTGIEITTPATQTTFWQGETFNYTDLVVTAHFDGAADEVVTPTVTGSTATAGTQTVTVSYTEGTTTETANYTITIKAIPNTKETAYTVADAYDIIDKLTTAEGVFIKGIVSQVDEYLTTYKSITYWISDDGTTTKQLQAYSGKGLDGAEFSDINGVSKADQVIVCGNLKKHTDGTYEFNYNNYLVEHTKTSKADPELSYTTTEYNVNLGDAFTAPTLNNPNILAVTYSSNNEDVATVAADGAVTIKAAGTVVITASFAGNDDYVAGGASYTINITDPNQLEATFVAGTDKSDTKSISKNGITVTFTDGTFSRDDNYRCYAGEEMSISYNDGNITKIVFTCDGSSYGPDKFSTETVTYSYSGSVGTWVGDAKSVTFAASSQVRMKDITVYYKKDNRAEAGLAWNPATVSLTVGDAFTAPTFSNPNNVTGIEFTSSNSELATVNNEGVISLVSGKTGTATITATFADGDATYKPAEVTCVITVSPKSEKVVILAEYNGQWYALKNVEQTAGKVLAALPVNYVGGKLYNVVDADKATIEWQLAIDGTIATFKNGENYISGTAGSADMKLATTECEWTYDGSSYMIGNRTFLYRAQANGFKNYNAEDNAGTDDYSELPVVTAPVYVNSKAALTGKFSTGEYEYAEFAPGNLQYNVGSSTWAFASEQYNVIGEPNINVGDPTFTGTIDMFGWSADGKFGVNPSNKNENYTGEFQDWGTLFPVEANYSTLSADQWYYLLFQRDKASTLKQIAKINGVVGILLFPDDWAGMPEGCTVDTKTTEFTDDEGTIIIENYEYTLEQWEKLEDADAVFLPGAGRRTGGYGNKINYNQEEETNSANLNGEYYRWQYYTNYVPYYWTSTKIADNNIKYLTTYHVVSKDPIEYGVGYAHVGWGEFARYGQSVRLAKVTSTLIEIGDGDNSAVIAANIGKEMDVQVNRTFKANDGYYTICLPFNLEAEKIGTALQIASVTENVADKGINVVFTEVETLLAGQPYLVLPSENLTNPIFENVEIVNTTGETTEPVFGAGIKITFTGIINRGGITNESTESTEYYVGDKGWLYNGKVDKLGLRAFFTITDEAGNPTKVRARVVTREDAATGFENITNGENTTIKVIENGQLIIIRDGIKYNAQGQKL